MWENREKKNEIEMRKFSEKRYFFLLYRDLKGIGKEEIRGKVTEHYYFSHFISPEKN